MKNKRLKKYVIKYTLEFIVIVLGISVSFWVNQVAVEKNENKERKLFTVRWKARKTKSISYSNRGFFWDS